MTRTSLLVRSGLWLALACLAAYVFADQVLHAQVPPLHLVARSVIGLVAVTAALLRFWQAFRAYQAAR